MEILFKARRKETKEWVDGYLIQLCGGRKFIINNKFGACINNRVNFINTESPFVNEVLPETVGQFTGRKIDNGEEEIKLFAGDILGWSVDYDDSFGYSKTSYDTGVIVWDDENCCYALKAEDGSLTDFEIDESCEIIGNIHDQSEGDAE